VGAHTCVLCVVYVYGCVYDCVGGSMCVGVFVRGHAHACFVLCSVFCGLCCVFSVCIAFVVLAVRLQVYVVRAAVRGLYIH
jgi:hypothetical protein